MKKSQEVKKDPGEYMLKSGERCIRTVEELIEYIDKIGFLPLFKNDILGFSVEEHTNAADWWSEDSRRDLWEWRVIITRSGKAAYGRFFHGKAELYSFEIKKQAGFGKNGEKNFEGIMEEGQSEWVSVVKPHVAVRR